MLSYLVNLSATATPMQGNTTDNSTSGNNCTPHFEMTGETKATTIYLPILMAIVSVASLIGNALVLSGVIRTRSKPPSYYLIANIALTEFIVTCLTPLYFSYWSKPFVWPFGEVMCTLTDSILGCCYRVVSFMLASLSVYFFCVLVAPTSKRPTRRMSYILVALSWVWGIVVGSPAFGTMKFVVYDNLFDCVDGSPFQSEQCRSIVPPHINKDAVIIMHFICQLIAPFVVMALCYGVVVVKVKQHIKVIKEDQAETTELGTAASQTDDTALNHNDGARPSLLPPPPPTENQENGKPCKIVKMERKLLKMIYVMIFIYIVCYCPDHFVLLAAIYDWFDPAWLKYGLIIRKHLLVLHIFSSALHPFLYGFLSRIIQRNFKRCS